MNPTILVNAMNLLQQFEAEQITRTLPKFGPGDTVVVNVKVKEGNRERVQAYEGVVIAMKNAGLSSAFTVRKMSHGTGVERVFQSHSQIIESVVVPLVSGPGSWKGMAKSATMTVMSEPTAAKPCREPSTTRMPTPAEVAETKDSTAPS